MKVSMAELCSFHVDNISLSYLQSTKSFKTTTSILSLIG